MTLRWTERSIALSSFEIRLTTGAPHIAIQLTRYCPRLACRPARRKLQRCEVCLCYGHELERGASDARAVATVSS